MTIALGELNLHPWEFRRYSWEEFISKLEGSRAIEKTKVQLIRAHAFKICQYSGGHGGMKKNTKVERFWPLEDDRKDGKVQAQSLKEQVKNLQGTIKAIQQASAKKK